MVDVENVFLCVKVVREMVEIVQNVLKNKMWFQYLLACVLPDFIKRKTILNVTIVIINVKNVWMINPAHSAT